jgi:3'(2'), 5'-bisphosphate nucleotidase
MLNQIDIQDVITIAKEAGDAIMKIYNQDFEVEYKQDNSPLTLADKMLMRLLKWVK